MASVSVPLLRLTLTAMLVASGLSLTSQAQTADDAAETSRRLAELQQQIDAVQSRMASQETERDALLDGLRETEQQIGSLDNRLNALNIRQGSLEAELQDLALEATRLQQQQAGLEGDMAAGIEQMWLMQQGGGLRVWLGDHDPQEIALNLALYELVLKAQQSAIKEYQQGLEDIAANTLAIEQAELDLTHQSEAMRVTRASLDVAQAQRRDTLAQVEAALQTDQDTVAALERDREALNRLLADLEVIAARLPEQPRRQPFIEAKGALLPPLDSAPSNRFGAQRRSGIPWQGWHIPTTQGTAVKAIHAGRVIFADWLRGQGLLVILDHGDGWLSLYAHNHSLRRALGDEVLAGDTLASAGSSGGSDEVALYFEIRHEGTPVDPALWIRR